MDKPGGPSRCWREEKSGMDSHYFDKGQLLDPENEDVVEEKDAKDM